ncbi:MAG: hypothetical protein RJA38_1367, partial [Bacteroidota bacterium]
MEKQVSALPFWRTSNENNSIHRRLSSAMGGIRF